MNKKRSLQTVLTLTIIATLIITIVFRVEVQVFYYTTRLKQDSQLLPEYLLAEPESTKRSALESFVKTQAGELALVQQALRLSLPHLKGREDHRKMCFGVIGETFLANWRDGSESLAHDLGALENPKLLERTFKLIKLLEGRTLTIGNRRCRILPVVTALSEVHHYPRFKDGRYFSPPWGSGLSSSIDDDFDDFFSDPKPPAYSRYERELFREHSVLAVQDIPETDAP